MLARLEQLQRELHKTFTAPDKILGFYYEFMVITRQIKEDVDDILGPFQSLMHILGRVLAARDGNMIEEMQKPLIPPDSNHT